MADYKRPSHRRHDSAELDVFEAARYFSGYNDNFAIVGGANMTPNMATREEKHGYLRGGRISLDMPSLRYNLNHQYTYPIAHQQQQKQQQQQQQQVKEKKNKQPSSPGGKLAHFLNSLLSSKKKKSSKSTTQSMKDEDESPSGRRKRRSSISHFMSTSSAVDAKSVYSCSSSGFRTPPPYNLNTPIKNYKEFKSFSDHKEALSKHNKDNVSTGNGNGNGNAMKDEKITKESNLDWVVDEKIKHKNGLVDQKENSNLHHGYQEKKSVSKSFKEEFDDGAESDSSSDLFELQIDYQFDFCSSGLPVYETTHMDSIKRASSTAITNGPIKT